MTGSGYLFYIKGVAPGAQAYCAKLCWVSPQIFKLRRPITFLFGPTDQEHQQHEDVGGVVQDMEDRDV